MDREADLLEIEVGLYLAPCVHFLVRVLAVFKALASPRVVRSGARFLK